jgi:hypothetical protein
LAPIFTVAELLPLEFGCGVGFGFGVVGVVGVGVVGVGLFGFDGVGVVGVGFVGSAGPLVGTGTGTGTTTTGIAATLLLLPPLFADADVGSSSRIVWQLAAATAAKPNRSTRFGFVMASPSVTVRETM